MKHIKKTGKYFPMNATGHMKIDIDFFDFLGVICRFSIYLRFEVHFFVCIGKWKDTSRINLLEALWLPKIYMWPVFFHFSMQTKKVYFNP